MTKKHTAQELCALSSDLRKQGMQPRIRPEWPYAQVYSGIFNLIPLVKIHESASISKNCSGWDLEDLGESGI